MFHRQPADRDLQKRLGLEGRFIVGYIGTHGMAHDLEGLLEAWDKCPNPSAMFMAIGAGARKQALVDMVGRKGLQNVLLLDPVPSRTSLATGA